jgi:hypothetical protein
MNMIDFGRALIASFLLVFLFGDAVFMIYSKGRVLPYNHKELLLTGTLLWIGTLFFNPKRDEIGLVCCN